MFACPVSKEQSTEQNPPMMMNCGHVITKDSLQKLRKPGGYVYGMLHVVWSGGLIRSRQPGEVSLLSGRVAGRVGAARPFLMVKSRRGCEEAGPVTLRRVLVVLVGEDWLFFICTCNCITRTHHRLIKAGMRFAKCQDTSPAAAHGRRLVLCFCSLTQFAVIGGVSPARVCGSNQSLPVAVKQKRVAIVRRMRMHLCT